MLLSGVLLLAITDFTITNGSSGRLASILNRPPLSRSVLILLGQNR